MNYISTDLAYNTTEYLYSVVTSSEAKTLGINILSWVHLICLCYTGQILWNAYWMQPTDDLELYPDLLTQENRDALIASGQNAWKVVDELDYLHRQNPDLITQENFDALIASGPNALHVADGLFILYQRNPNLLTQENRAALIESGPNAAEVARGLSILQRENPDLLTQENRDTLIASGPNAQDVAIGLYFLHRDNPDLLTQENRAALIASGANAAEVALGLSILYETNPALLTQENRAALIASGPNAQNLAIDLSDIELNIQKFEVRYSDLQNQPLMVLQTWANLAQPPGKIEFLDDNGIRYPGVDAGGISKQFYTELAKNLFCTETLFEIDDEGLLRIPGIEDSPEEKKMRRGELGKMIAYLYSGNYLTGNVVSPKFFLILKIAQNTDLNRLDKQTAISQILDKPYLHTIQSWLNGDESKKQEVLTYYQEFFADPEYNPPEEELKQEGIESITGAANAYLRAAEQFLEGISPEDPFIQDLQAMDSDAISRKVQGDSVSSDALIALIDENEVAPNIQIKINWLKERIQEKAEDTEWLEKFLFSITAQKSLNASTKIKIAESHDNRCRARTCFNELCIPSVDQEKEEFLEHLEDLVANFYFGMA